ncbi:hypothetical protein GGTG_07630 [Gaeumannomyces tritici R3-111a-1]|uniref:Uncharacterized protein n=1 Tax=Gaeumannomyces tritici (strain R3-111a-1) TaxID=644352 RepID=J3P282_GAET3|nr:hypothetical protein GGTG_07630 [Gaeumannomyces tritici R3-111a-1]EJT73774.1 hypothetical protein GGTG_07630 [Gaeumannomyces tritici R3-111a-1]
MPVASRPSISAAPALLATLERPPEPVELVEVSAQLRPLLEAGVASIPGLHLCGEDNGWGASAFIGWGAANVEAKARAAKDARDRKLAEDREREEAKERAWEEEKRALREKPHKDFTATYKPTPGPLTLDDLVGRWEVKDSEPLVQPYGDDEMFMEITKATSAHGAAGRFSFGLVEGALLLAMSEDSLHKLKDELEDSEDDGEEADGYGCGVPVGKRKVHQGAGGPPSSAGSARHPSPTECISSGQAASPTATMRQRALERSTATAAT